MDKNMETYVFYGGNSSIELFEVSREKLMESECDDFMVYRQRDNTDISSLEGEHPEDWEGPIAIDQNTYFLLHLNLCQKAKKSFSKRFRPKTGKHRK